jgi:hypothetical protein
MKIKTPSEYRRGEFRPLIIELVKLFKPKQYVEINSRNGHVFNMLSTMIPHCHAVGIPEETITGRDGVTCFVGNPVWYFDYLKKNFQGTEFIDLVYISNVQDRDELLLWVDTVASYVRIGTGLILLHNTYPVNEALLDDGYCGNAWEAATVIRRFFNNHYEILTLPGPWAGLSIIRKVPFDRHFAWKLPVATTTTEPPEAFDEGPGDDILDSMDVNEEQTDVESTDSMRSDQPDPYADVHN